MGRHFFTLASLSLVLCIAAGVLWVRSYWTQDCVAIETARYPYLGIDPTGEPMYKDRINNVRILINHGHVDVDWMWSADDGYLGPET